MNELPSEGQGSQSIVLKSKIPEGREPGGKCIKGINDINIYCCFFNLKLKLSLYYVPSGESQGLDKIISESNIRNA